MTGPCPRPDCVVTRAALDVERARRTLGGTPPPTDASWANLPDTPPPTTAADEMAPPLRRPGRASSTTPKGT